MFRVLMTASCFMVAANVSTRVSLAQDCNATAFVVHGIPGTDLEAATEFPVDISVNGTCALPGFEFSAIAGPVPLPGGINEIAIAPANAALPCGNEAVLSASLDLECGVNYSIVAYLDADGLPTAGLFVNNAAPTDRGTSRLIVAHTAAAPMVDISVRRDGPDSPGIDVENFFNGEQAEADVRPGEWNVAIFPAGENTAVFGPVTVELKPYTAYLVYAVGSLDYKTFTLLSQPIGGLKPMKVLGTSESASSQGLRAAKPGR